MAEFNTDLRDLRRYEVSIWTLQDRFLSVLKWFNLEQKGQIQEPEITLKDDGTQEFNFSIPQLYYDGETKIPNPMWYQLQEMPIEANMHKLKVVFNKNIEQERITNLSSFVIKLKLNLLSLFNHTFDLTEESFIDETTGEIMTINQANIFISNVVNEYNDNKITGKDSHSIIEQKLDRLKKIMNMTETVLEFLVVSVVYNHSADEIIIDIKAEGLAFHELGKLGYKISLNQDDYDLDLTNWFKTNNDVGDKEDFPMDIHYWNKKIFGNDKQHKKTNWYYKVDMDWSAHSYAAERQIDQVYEDEYVSAWQLDGDKLAAKAVEGMRIRWASIDVKESNIYNITQQIAENFNVFCRYEYTYDENYNIIDRTVVYYNNYIQDKQGHIDLTYPYTSSSIKRTVDATNVTTKLFVHEVDSEATGSDVVTIMDVDANKSKEDYLLNFDYLYKIGTITQEQYDAIEIYISQMHELNTKYYLILDRINVLESQLVELEATQTVAKNAMDLADERYNDAKDQLDQLTNNEGNISTTSSTVAIPDSLNEGYYYIALSQKGIVRNSVHIYKEFDSKANIPRKNTEILNWGYQEDEFGMVTRIINIDLDDSENRVLYYTLDYNPFTYYNKIIDVWNNRKYLDKVQYDEATNEINKINYYLWGIRADFARADQSRTDEGALYGGYADGYVNPITGEVIYSYIDECRANNETGDADMDEINDTIATPDLYYNRDRLYSEKQFLIDKFNRMMGPALREGYWQPEDTHDYGDVFKDQFTIIPNQYGRISDDNIAHKKDYVEFIWDDNKYYDNELPYIYQVSVDGTEEPYVAINLTDYMNTFKKYFDHLVFFYYDIDVLITIYEMEKQIQQADLTKYLNNDNEPLINCDDLNNGYAVLKTYNQFIEQYINLQLQNYVFTNDSNGEKNGSIRNVSIAELSNDLSIIDMELDRLTELGKNLKDSELKNMQIEQYNELIDNLNKIKLQLTELKRINSIIDSRYDWIASLQKNALRSFSVGSQCELGWLQKDNNQPIPVLLLIEAKNLDKNTIKYITTGKFTYKEMVVENDRLEVRDTEVNIYGNDSESDENWNKPMYLPFIGYYETIEEKDKNGKVIKSMFNPVKLNTIPFNNVIYPQVQQIIVENAARWPEPQEFTYRRVYPRIYFNTLKLKEGGENLIIKLNNNVLENYEDYYTIADDRSKGLKIQGVGYYTTLKPEKIFKLGAQDANIDLLYTLSNLDTSIYLDAIKVSKENAFPKVSYDVELSVLNPDFVKTAYNKLNQIVQINDVDLQLEDVNGYISTVTLKLDKPYEDTVEIKNYETKFEDLFSTIVAQTEAMKKGESGLNNAVRAFTSTGLIQENILQDSIRSANLELEFNKGKLKITEEDGIWAIKTDDSGNVSGVIAFRGGGIFTATDKDKDGKWIWNTGILPSGINANLITTGQLDTNLIKVYAGDQLRFQLNGQGMFAYKPDTLAGDTISVFNQETQAYENITVEKNNLSLDQKQYVLYNSEGIFLRSEKGAYYPLPNDKFGQVESDKIDRVEISWNGLILRNWENRDVFFASPDTGDLTLRGRIEAESGEIGGWEINPNVLSGNKINLISNSSNNESGIFLTGEETLQDTVDDELTHKKYYVYEDEQHSLYYLESPAISNDPINISTIITPVYLQKQILSQVSPKYTKEETVVIDGTSQETIENQGIAITTSSSAEVKVYVMLSENENDYALDSNSEKIIYDQTTDLNSEWYTKLQETYPNDDYLNYIDTIFINQYERINEEQHLLLTPTGASGVTFSVRADDGYVTILKGRLGNFTITNNSISGGIISGSTLDKSNILFTEINSEEEEITHTLGEVFYDIQVDENSGDIRLKRVNGTIANFNIAAMQAYKDAIAAASTVKLTLQASDGKIIATATSG